MTFRKSFHVMIVLFAPPVYAELLLTTIDTMPLRPARHFGTVAFAEYLEVDGNRGNVGTSCEAQMVATKVYEFLAK